MVNLGYREKPEKGGYPRAISDDFTGVTNAGLAINNMTITRYLVSCTV